MPRRKRKRNLLLSIALAPITIPAKMTNGILLAGGAILTGGLISAFTNPYKRNDMR